MSLTYKTVCDGCDKAATGWGSATDWAQVNFANIRKDYCPDCWKTVRLPTPTKTKVNTLP